MKNSYDINWLINKYENGDNLDFLYFWGHTNESKKELGKFCLSQWYESTFQTPLASFRTAEHWMMAQKALLFGDIDIYSKIINCGSPSKAKELGRLILHFDEQIWNEKKLEIVKLGNIHKFNQDYELSEFLLSTENKILVEASPTDCIWGIGLAADSIYIDNIYAWRGQNLLGFILMETRDFLREFGRFSYLDHAMEAPWIKFSNIDSNDMFWRMGKGEDYLCEFLEFFQKLSGREKIIYNMYNPPPGNWNEIYE